MRLSSIVKLAALVATLVILISCSRSEQAARPAAAEGKKETRPAASTPAATAGTDVGAVMPEYASMWLDGSKFELASRRDKVVLLNLWATWCGPCRYEIPELQAIHDRYAPRGFEVIGVSVDESGVESVRQFVQEHKMTYPVVLDAEGKLATILQTSVLPTSVLLDRKGKIVWKKFGAIMPEDQELDQAIKAAL